MLSLGPVMYLGIDIGTSAVKAIVIDDDEALLASASAEVETSRPKPLWSEQQPEDWWTAVGAALSELRRAFGSRLTGVKAIGLSGQMHGNVVLDGAMNSIRPAIIWNDGRALVECVELAERIPAIGHICGVPPMPGFSAPKYRWLMKHEPENFAQIRHVMVPKDYVRFKMTGEFATDMSDASGMLLLDAGRRQWSQEVVEACGLSPTMLPKLLEGTEISGRLRVAIADAWGLAPGTPVVAGAGDAAAGAVGAGAIKEGDAFISLGTSGQYFIARENYVPSPESLIHTFCHCLPGRWFQMAAMLNGASPLGWAAKLLGESDISKLLLEAEAEKTAAPQLYFLPYLTGERTPHNDPHAKGCFIGLTPATTRGQTVRAVLEGTGFMLADCQDILGCTGTLPEEVAVVGGGSKSALWMQIIADTLGRPVLQVEAGESGPALGAARLARIGTSGEPIGAVCRKPRVTGRFAPDPQAAAAYARRLPIFREAYRALKPVFRMGA